eukprot:evm.model.scf_350.6 EVM.evm.TU.scf_350.6   scf_350:89906-91794(+)
MARASTSGGRAAVAEPLLPPDGKSGALIPAAHASWDVGKREPRPCVPLLDRCKHPERIGPALAKVSANVVALCCLVVFLCYVDRAYVGLSASQLLADLGWGEEVYGTGVSVFFLGYVAFQIPSTMLMQQLGTPTWMGASLFVWGCSAAATAFVKTPGQFYFVRFVLGLAESGTFPGVWYYLGLFIPQSRITFSIAAVDVTLVMSQVLSPLAAAGLLRLDGFLGMHGWQWLFVSEAAPTIAVAACFWFGMPRGPAEARFLSSEDVEALEEEMRAGQGCSGSGSCRGAKPVFDQLYDALMNPRLWGCALIYLLRLMAMYVMLFWSVLLITAMRSGDGLRPPCLHGASSCEHAVARDDTAVLLATLPYGAAALATLANAWHSQATNERRLHVALPFMAGAAIFAGMPVLADVSVALGLAALTAGAVGAVSGGSVLTTMASASLPQGSKAFGLGLYNAVANLGGIIGPMVTGVIVEKSGSYREAVVTMAMVLFAGGFLVVFLRDPLAPQRGAKGGAGAEEEEGAPCV